MSVSERLKIARKERGLTLQKLADLAGTSKSYIWELENKNPPRTSARKLTSIATALGVTPVWLMHEAESLEDAEDAAFYQEYLKLDEREKKKVRAMLKILTTER